MRRWQWWLPGVFALCWLITNGPLIQLTLFRHLSWEDWWRVIAFAPGQFLFLAVLFPCALIGLYLALWFAVKWQGFRAVSRAVFRSYVAVTCFFVIGFALMGGLMSAFEPTGQFFNLSDVGVKRAMDARSQLRKWVMGPDDQLHQIRQQRLYNYERCVDQKDPRDLRVCDAQAAEHIDLAKRQAAQFLVAIWRRDDAGRQGLVDDTMTGLEIIEQTVDVGVAALCGMLALGLGVMRFLLFFIERFATRFPKLSLLARGDPQNIRTHRHWFLASVATLFWVTGIWSLYPPLLAYTNWETRLLIPLGTGNEAVPILVLVITGSVAGICLFTYSFGASWPRWAAGTFSVLVFLGTGIPSISRPELVHMLLSADSPIYVQLPMIFALLMLMVAALGGLVYFAIDDATEKSKE